MQTTRLHDTISMVVCVFQAVKPVSFIDVAAGSPEGYHHSGTWSVSTGVKGIVLWSRCRRFGRTLPHFPGLLTLHSGRLVCLGCVTPSNHNEKVSNPLAPPMQQNESTLCLHGRCRSWKDDATACHIPAFYNRNAIANQLEPRRPGCLGEPRDAGL